MSRDDPCVMHYRQLGKSGLQVSAIALGTMTWGEQNTEAQAHAQLDRALDAGVNFIDTAELYPIPPRAETQGRTETYIGSWLRAKGKRDAVVIATKAVGRANWLPHFRGGQARLDRKNLEEALDASLRRLGTDYIDLYQTHWPDRRTNFFGRLGYVHPADDEPEQLEETVETLAGFVRSGKVRQIGVSNETPWGMMRYLEIARAVGGPEIVSIQNPYSLLNRSFEVGCAEISHREGVGLLAYSPLGFGVLSGKYLGGVRPPGTRLALFEGYNRYCKPEGLLATEAYVSLARASGLDPAQMALAFVLSRSFVTSVIIGATSMEQLESNIASVELDLSRDVLEAIEAIHQQHPNPAP